MLLLAVERVLHKTAVWRLLIAFGKPGCRALLWVCGLISDSEPVLISWQLSWAAIVHPIKSSHAAFCCSLCILLRSAPLLCFYWAGHIPRNCHNINRWSVVTQLGSELYRPFFSCPDIQTDRGRNVGLHFLLQACDQGPQKDWENQYANIFYFGAFGFFNSWLHIFLLLSIDHLNNLQTLIRCSRVPFTDSDKTQAFSLLLWVMVPKCIFSSFGWRMFVMFAGVFPLQRLSPPVQGFVFFHEILWEFSTV